MNGIFERNGFRAYLVGGAVRDMLMGRPAADWDVATDAAPRQVMSIFRRVIPTGIAHGTVTVLFSGRKIEVTTFRTEHLYSDGRHPDEVKFAATIEDDLSRRDFTMNAVAASLRDGTIVDPFGGRADIGRRIIRTVGNPEERFSEDGLRPVRALRFVAQLGFELERRTYEAACGERIHEITAGISAERFRDELVKILAAEKPSAAIRLMEETGILKIFMPEFTACRGCVQADARGFHEFDVMDHLLYACDGAPRGKPAVRLAALLHDIGKPAVRETRETEAGGIITFHNHEQVSAETAAKMLRRLRFPNAVTESAVRLIQNHMFHYEPAWTDAAVRRFLARVGPENVEDLFDLRLADIYGTHGRPVRIRDSEAGRNLSELKSRIEKTERQNDALGIRDLAVNGRDLIEAGIPEGKVMGEILRGLLEIVLDDPSQNSRETLLAAAGRIYGSV